MRPHQTPKPAAGEDHGLGREFLQKGIGDFLKRMDFAIDIQFAQPPRNQLGNLRAEIDNEELVCHGKRIQKSRRFRKINRYVLRALFTVLAVFVVS